MYVNFCNASYGLVSTRRSREEKLLETTAEVGGKNELWTITAGISVSGSRSYAGTHWEKWFLV